MALPSGYTQLDYVYTNGGLYINTGITHSVDYGETVNMGFEFVGTSSSEQCLFGCYTSFNYSQRLWVSGTTGKKWYYRWRNNEYTSSSSWSLNTRYNISALLSTTQRLTVNGTAVINETNTSNTNGQSMYLFAANNNTAATCYANIKFYSCTIVRNGTTLRNYVPARRDSDGFVGLYETVSQGFTGRHGGSTYFTTDYTVSATIDPIDGGTVNGTGKYRNNTSATLTATPANDYNFDYWDIDISGTTSTSTSNPLSLTVNNNASLIAHFYIPYNINLQYDSTLGTASYIWLSSSEIQLTANSNNNAKFIGWYVNSVLISNQEIYTYTVASDITIEARFTIIYQLNTSVVGQGAIDYIRYGIGNNDITITVIPSDNWHFVKYEIIGVTETQENPLNITLIADTTVVAYFEENDRYTINTTTNVEHASIYLSQNNVYSGTKVTLFARPIADHYFVGWGDGVLDNPREITVTSNITVSAVYQRISNRVNIYSYRCYIKDQLNLTDPPKAFLRVDNFTIKTDILTNANSTINLLETSSNINNGDILVLYDETGTTLYQGVIKSIEDKRVQCSQMQSFYKGDWIYNVYPSSTLEQEIAYLLGQYSQGKIYGSSWVDPLVAQRLGGITIRYEGSTSAKLPTDKDENNNERYSVQDMEKFIYSLYENYGIIFDFEINFSGANYVTIKVPNFETVKVGNNMYAIKDMEPIQKIEETNRLIIYGQDKSYRTTYVATGNGVVERPSSTAGRFNITNTKIVFSDDDISDLVSANLPTQMYNHKLVFTLIIKNFIYQFGEFNLGGTLDVWHGEDYYNTVLTGYEIKKASNQNITEVDFTCGLVRTALTKLLTLGRVS